MKILIINGSPRVNGNSEKLIEELTKTFDSLNAECEVVDIANKDVRGCIACGYCSSNKGCVFKDIVNETSPKFEQADGLIVVSPVYYASPNGTLISF